MKEYLPKISLCTHSLLLFMLLPCDDSMAMMPTSGSRETRKYWKSEFMRRERVSERRKSRSKQRQGSILQMVRNEAPVGSVKRERDIE